MLEPTPEAEEAYVQEVRSLARMGLRYYTECTPGYYNSEGQAGNRQGFFSDMYGAGPLGGAWPLARRIADLARATSSRGLNGLVM